MFSVFLLHPSENSSGKDFIAAWILSGDIFWGAGILILVLDFEFTSFLVFLIFCSFYLFILKACQQTMSPMRPLTKLFTSYILNYKHWFPLRKCINVQLSVFFLPSNDRTRKLADSPKKIDKIKILLLLLLFFSGAKVNRCHPFETKALRK